MMDWADGTQTRNYGIKCVTNSRTRSDLLRIILSFVMVAGALLFYSWVRSQIVTIGYESQKLLAKEESLLRTQKALIIKEEILRSPERIDTIARNELGLTPMRPNQLIMPELQNEEQSASDTLAMANPEANRLKKPAANN